MVLKNKPPDPPVSGQPEQDANDNTATSGEPGADSSQSLQQSQPSEAPREPQLETPHSLPPVSSSTGEPYQQPDLARRQVVAESLRSPRYQATAQEEEQDLVLDFSSSHTSYASPPAPATANAFWRPSESAALSPRLWPAPHEPVNPYAPAAGLPQYVPQPAPRLSMQHESFNRPTSRRQSVPQEQDRDRDRYFDRIIVERDKKTTSRSAYKYGKGPADKPTLQDPQPAMQSTKPSLDCKSCGKSFARKDTLRRHLEIGCPTQSADAPVSLPQAQAPGVPYSRARRQLQETTDLTADLHWFSSTVSHPSQDRQQEDISDSNKAKSTQLIIPRSRKRSCARPIPDEGNPPRSRAPIYPSGFTTTPSDAFIKQIEAWIPQATKASEPTADIDESRNRPKSAAAPLPEPDRGPLPILQTTQQKQPLTEERRAEIAAKRQRLAELKELRLQRQLESASGKASITEPLVSSLIGETAHGGVRGEMNHFEHFEVGEEQHMEQSKDQDEEAMLLPEDSILSFKGFTFHEDEDESMSIDSAAPPVVHPPGDLQYDARFEYFNVQTAMQSQKLANISDQWMARTPPPVFLSPDSRWTDNSSKKRSKVIADYPKSPSGVVSPREHQGPLKSPAQMPSSLVPTSLALRVTPTRTVETDTESTVQHKEQANCSPPAPPSSRSSPTPTPECTNPYLLRLKGPVIAELLRRFTSSAYSKQHAGSQSTQSPPQSTPGHAYSIQEGRSKKPKDAKKPKRKRPSAQDDEDASSDSDSPAQPKRGKASPSSLPSLWACPFLKHKPLKYQACYSYTLKDISRVKQHLRRRHKIPLHCPICRDAFPSEESRDTHLVARTCSPAATESDRAPYEGVTQAQQEMLERRVDKSKTKAEQWFSIYEILFPDAPQPESPFLDAEISAQLRPLREFLAAEGQGIVQEVVRRQMPAALRPREEEVLAFSEGVFDEVMNLALQRYDASRRTAAAGSTPGDAEVEDKKGGKKDSCGNDSGATDGSTEGSPPWDWCDWPSDTDPLLRDYMMNGKEMTGLEFDPWAPDGMQEPSFHDPTLLEEYPVQGFGVHGWGADQLGYLGPLSSL